MTRTLDLFRTTVSFANLGSGSRGNASLVCGGSDAVLVDCGLSYRQLKLRAEAAQLDLSSVRGILITHEHTDHVSGARVVSKRLGVPVYMTAGCKRRVKRTDDFEVRTFVAGQAFQIGCLTIEPYRVPHDTVDPVGFVVGHGRDRVGVATDMGSVNRLVVDKLRSCRVVLLEFNHDVPMLLGGSYPWALKQRVRGRLGHLSNEQGAEILRSLAGSSVEAVVLGHLSEHNNAPRLAMEAARTAVAESGSDIRIRLAEQGRPTDAFHLLERRISWQPLGVDNTAENNVVDGPAAAVAP